PSCSGPRPCWRRCCLDEGGQCPDRDHDVVCVQNVVGVQLVCRQCVHVRQVGDGLASGQVLTGEDDQDLLALGQTLQEGTCRLGGWDLARYELLDHVDAGVACAVRQGAAQCGGLHLLRGALG